VKRSLFHGFETQQVAGGSMRVASPGKALMDLWYLEAGEWSPQRMESMRFEPDAIDIGVLESMIHGSGIPRLKVIAKAWMEYSEESARVRIWI
jgi:hypothetical protein